VTDLTFPAAKNTFHHDALRNERWIGAGAGRELVTNVSTGKVREDCQYTLTEARCWAAPLNAKEPAAGTTYIMAGNPILLESWDDVGAGVKELVGQSRGYGITGNTTFLGRPALTLNQVAQRGPDGGIESATVIAEADNYYPLFREDTDTNQPLRFARSILRSRPDAAEDVVQEALMRAHRALLRDDRMILLGPWLAKLARNCALERSAA
jgi:hypothetical protein